MKIEKAPIPLIVPNPDDPRLTERVRGTDQTGAEVDIRVPVERPLTLYLNAQEIVTMMTIGDYPEYLALGYLLNQNMLKYGDVVTEVEAASATAFEGLRTAIVAILDPLFVANGVPAGSVLFTPIRSSTKVPCPPICVTAT